MTTERTETSYCQNCICITNNLTLETIHGRDYWLCEKCKNPLPKEAYSLRLLKSWGDTAYEKKGTRNS